MIDSYLQYLNEMAYYVSPSVQNILKKTPKVTKKEFISRMQPSDIIVSFTAKKEIKDKKSMKILAKVVASFQGSPYTSSKVVLDNNMVGGYGVVSREALDSSVVGKISISEYVKERGEMCLIRIPELTKKQQIKVVSYVKSMMGVSYNSSSFFKSVWNRLFNRKILPFFKNEKIDPKELEIIKEPLICSSLVSLSYLIAGYKKDFNKKRLYDVWPKDFLLDNDTEKICRIEM